MRATILLTLGVVFAVVLVALACPNRVTECLLCLGHRAMRCE